MKTEKQNNGFLRTTSVNKLLKLKKRNKVVQGGTSAGKTFGILPILINKASKISNLEISVVSESIPHLRRGAMKDFLKVLQMTNRFISTDWNRSTLTYKFPNGSYIEFFSADQEDKLRGARRNILYVNEANNINWEAFYQMYIRTNREVWIDYNPTAEFWAHRELMNEPDTDFIKLTYKDNEALDDSIVKEIEKAKVKAETSDYWANWWKVYGLGETGTLQGVVFNNWKQMDRLPNDAKLLGYGLDFGFTNDPTTLIGVYQYNGAYIYDELIYQTDLTNADISRLMDSKGVSKALTIYADSAEPKSITELKRMGWRVVAAEKGKDSINFGIQIMQQNEFFVTSQSTNLIKELRSYMWAKDRAGNYTGKPEDAFNHSLDAIRYYHLSKNKVTGKYAYARI